MSKIEETRARRAKYSKIKSAVGSAVAIVKNPRIINNAKRMAICESCEFYKGVKCTKCGCFMHLKTVFAATKCPIGKW